MLVFSVLLGLTITAASAMEKYDRFEKIQNVSLQTGKDGSERHFRSFTKEVIPRSAEQVLGDLLSFEKSCNNELAGKRKQLSEDFDCANFDRDVIENVVHTELKSNAPLAAGELRRLVVGRRVYNRGEYGYYELVRVFKTETGYRVTLELLKDKKAREYVTPEIAFDYFFHRKHTEYVLSRSGEHSSELKLITEASTRNWFLNKAFSVGQVFQGLVTDSGDLFGRFLPERSSSEMARALASERK